MAKRLEADPKLVQDAAGKAGQVRDRLQGVLNTLHNTLSANGSPWGNDKYGTKYVEGTEGYFAHRDGLGTSGQTMATNFSNFLNRQQTSTKMLKGRDGSNADSFS